MENQIFFIIIIIVIFSIYYIHCYYAKNNIDKFENIQNQLQYDYFSNPKSNSNLTLTDSNANLTESHNLLSLNPGERCNILGKKKFTIRDIRTQLWLISGEEKGFSKFLPGRFGIPFILSENPDEYLPLRTLAEPNDYLLSTSNGKEIRVVSNPTSKYYVLEICIYDGYNVIGYIDESETQKYLYVDNNGNITSTILPEKASFIELLFL